MSDETGVDLEREREVHSYGVVGIPQPELDDLALLATLLCRVPAAAISLMLSDIEAIVAAVGVDTGICEQADAMCTPVLHDAAPLFVPDVSLDPRWQDNPYVTGERASFRFYAVHPLETPRGIRIGTVCVLDEESRAHDDSVMAELARLAARIVQVLELRRQSRQLAATVQSLDSAKRELERSNEMLRLFAAQASHDLRGPISAINASLLMLEDDEIQRLDDQERVWLVKRALGSVARMNDLIREMLDFASVGSTPAADPVDLTALVHELRDDLVAELEGVDLVVRELPRIRGDRTQWRVVLQNLISNAVKFNDHEHPEITVAGYVEAGEWVIEVSDNGPGVPEDDRERVFGLMSQGDPTGEGIGLGLATCQRIIAAHGGIVVMRAIEPRGAQVHIRLPVQRPAVPD